MLDNNNMKKLYRLLDRFEEWRRYPQPSYNEKKFLGMYTDVIDTEFTATRLASEESARYVQENMRTVLNFDTDYDLHDWIPTQLNSRWLAEGLVLEFGVATGRTLNHFARLLPYKTIYGFDSFVGLPEDWTSRMRKGFFARSSLPPVRKNCSLIQGWFDQTLPEFVKVHTQPVALLHIDSDLYSSAVTILTLLEKQLAPGTVIVFDEYMNYPGWQQDEFKAWQEFCTAYNVQYQYIGRVSKHQKVAVRILAKS